MKQKLSLCLVSCLTLLSSSAFAAGDRAAAQKYFEQGAEYYFNGEYGKAIVEFMRGNDEIPNALLLYNISLSHSRLGNFNDALEFGRRAREMGGLDPATSAQNECRISALNAVQTSQSFQGPVELPGEDVPPVVSVVAPPPKYDFTLGYIGLATTATGLVLLGVAGYAELQVRDRWDAYEQAALDGNSVEYGRLGGEIDDYRAYGIPVGIGGAVFTLAGLTMLGIEILDEPDSPVVSTSGQDVRVRFSF